MKNTHPEFLAGYQQADLDNTQARAGLIEAIAEARREAADPDNHGSTRAYWKQKAERWQANLDGTIRVVLTGDGEWRGTLAEFFDTNDSLGEDEAAAIRQTIAAGKPWETGGGAAPLQTLRRVFNAEGSR
jgi:hypothetical protein